jgi:hypothetical protein
MESVLCESRSFGSSVGLITQNLGSAVHDARILSQIHTNVKWTLSMRGQPADCSFLKHALPIGTKKQRPQVNPFEPPGFYTENEERAMAMEEIASLPNRHAYVWLRSQCPEALKITTASIEIPDRERLENIIRPLLSDSGLGERVSRQKSAESREHCHDVSSDRVQEDLGATFANAYKKRARGKDV